MSASLTASVAAFAAGLKADALPKTGIDRARNAIADCIGCVLAGAPTRGSKIVLDLLLADGGKPISAVFGTASRLPPAAAALANGTAGHALDFDDMSPPMLGHPSVPLVPAILALAEEIGASGADVVTAYIAGFETQARLGRLINPAHYEHGWHATVTLGTLGAAVASGWLLKLDAAQMASAIGIAASQSGGLRQNFGTDVKPLHAGLAARSGVFSAQLAKAGFGGNPTVLEGPRGFLDIFRGSVPSRSEPFAPLFAPGSPFEIVETGITIKPYSCCGCTHSPLDALFDLVAENKITAGQVDHIECKVNRLAPEVLIHHTAETPMQAKFCVEYCLAVALLDGQAGLQQFTQKRVDDPAVQELLRKVKVAVDPELPVMEGAFPGEVVIHLKDGRRVAKRVFEARGHRDRALLPEELAGKFIGCATESIPKEQAERAFALLSDLTSLADLHALIQALSIRA